VAEALSELESLVVTLVGVGIYDLSVKEWRQRLRSQKTVDDLCEWSMLTRACRRALRAWAVCVCVRSCVRACMRACVCVHVCIGIAVWACMRWHCRLP
jgi:hypothetical protein